MVRAGRRTDLTGWCAGLVLVIRLLIFGAVAYAVWVAVRALPWLMWIVAGWWLRASWKGGGSATEQPEEEPVGSDIESVRALLLEAVGEGDAVHLRTVLTYLQERGHGNGWTVGGLRSQRRRRAPSD
ncbi:hypothetical protein [Streptomyces sp. NPDC056337]|uniref:hypothetical protein n=1 Tax=Streptomyces sp. NPDC056337 TaxID=3345787 RepID=UPI0035DDA6C1